MPRRAVRPPNRTTACRTATAPPAAGGARNSRRRHLRDSHRNGGRLMAPRTFTRAQRMPIVQGILAFALILVVLQLWLLTATMNAYLGGDDGVVWPAAVASALCFALNAGLLVYLRRLEKPRH